MLLERWKRIDDFPNYEISDWGRVRRMDGLYLKLGTFKGYTKLSLTQSGGKRVPRLVHRLVAKAFVPNPYNLPEVNHRDLAKGNNHFTNLEWVTRKGNMQHYFETTHPVVLVGEDHHTSKLTNEDVKKVFSMREHNHSLEEIAKELGVHLAHVSDILNGVVWSHLGLSKPDKDRRRKLRDETYVEVFRLRSLHKTYVEISEIVGIHKGTVGDILRGRIKTGPASRLERIPWDGRAKTVR